MWPCAGNGVAEFHLVEGRVSCVSAASATGTAFRADRRKQFNMCRLPQQTANYTDALSRNRLTGLERFYPSGLLASGIPIPWKIRQQSVFAKNVEPHRPSQMVPLRQSGNWRAAPQSCFEAAAEARCARCLIEQNYRRTSATQTVSQTGLIDEATVGCASYPGQ